MLVFGLAAGRRVPPLGGLPHDLRRRRAAARARGHARDRRPRDRRGPARGGRRERVLPPRHVAPRVRARARAAARARAVRAAAGGRRVERVRARRSRTSRRRATPTTRCSAHWPPAAPPEPRLRVLRPADVLWRRDLGVLCGVLVSTEHLTVATLEIGPGEVAALHEHGGDEVLMALDGPLWVRAWHGDAVHVFELEPEDVCYLPAGSRARVPQPGRRRPRARSAASPRATCRDASRSARRRGDEDRRRARRRCDAATVVARAPASPTAPARGADAVLADCRALAAELGDGAARSGSPSASSSTRSGRVRSAETVDWRGDRPAAPTFDRRRVRRARGRAGRGALRRRPRRSRTSSTSASAPGISHCLMADGEPRLGVRGQRDRHRRAAGRAVVERARARAPHAATRRAEDGARRPGRRRAWSRTPRGGSGSCSPRSSTRSTPAR